MLDLPLTALRAFAAVYETGGIRPAARRLQVSHSAVSRHVRELEAWLDAALLQPGPGRLAFTPQGEALGRSALQHLGELERSVAQVRERRRANAVIVSTTASLAVRWLLPRLGLLQEEAAWIEVSVVVEQKLVDPAEQGVDLALRMGRGPWAGLACEPLMDDALFPAMSPAYWSKAKRPSRPDQLAGLRLLHDRDPQASWSAWKDAFGPAGLDAAAGPRFASSDLVLRAAAQGLGVALARSRLVSDDLASDALVRPFGPAEVKLPDAYWLVQAREARPRSAVRALTEWLHRQASAS